MKKARLDKLVVRKGLAENLRQAQSLIMAGQVLVDGHVMDKAGNRIPVGAQVTVREKLRYVSRGGIKLEHALDRFAVDVSEKTAVDIGASTGGFTDCLLQRGARTVYAIDVGYGQLAWQIRQDARVVVLDRTNIRHLASLPELVDLATVDVSFISLDLVLPQVVRLLRPEGDLLTLIKPQFEAEREQVGNGGVVRDPVVHRLVLEKVIRRAATEKLAVVGLIPSPLTGRAGNVEFFAHLSRHQRLDNTDIEEALKQCLGEAETICRL